VAEEPAAQLPTGEEVAKRREEAEEEAAGPSPGAEAEERAT